MTNRQKKNGRYVIIGISLYNAIIPTPPKGALECMVYASDYHTLALFFLIMLCVAIVPLIPISAPAPPASSM